MPVRRLRPLLLLPLALGATPARAGTVALWLFDEPAGVYPSSVLADAGPGSHFLILGRGAEIGPGRFGQALRILPPAPLTITARSAGSDADSGGSAVRFGLAAPPAIPGRTQPPLVWANAHFAALTTRGDAHLRRAPSANVTDSRLNVDGGDWTIEAWLRLDASASEEGVLLELGTGPRGENDLVTRLSLSPRDQAFVLTHLAPVEPGARPAAVRLVELPNPGGPPAITAALATATLVAAQPFPRERWFHAAVVHHRDGTLRLFVDGQPAASAAAPMLALPRSDESYLSVGRDGRWGQPFPGAIDELRVSDHAAYSAAFAPPASFSRFLGQPRPAPRAGTPLLFADAAGAAPATVLDLGSRTRDVSALAGRTVRLVAGLRRTSLDALQFIPR